jgi:2-polyprenyl-6-methoxyphenol hydroxylase-like FAD-dependent oxidoreductase
MDKDQHVIIIGGGIGGLTLALALHQAGVPCRVYEAAAELKPLGVGLNLLPHAVRELASLGLQDKLLARGVETQEYCFYTRHGQLIYREPRGRFSDYQWPQISIHRGHLHGELLAAVHARLGADAVVLGHKCVAVGQDAEAAVVRFTDPAGNPLPAVRGTVAVACDGVHSVARATMHPREAVPRYEGTTQYRGTTRWKPFLTGASMVYLGTYETGKLIMYPILDNIDGEGMQLFNWVIELSRPNDQLLRDWNRRSRVEEFIGHFEDWRFDWLDIPAVLRAADSVYEYPMIDQDPLPFWTQGRITLLGDAAHPMMPRGSNGAAQAIIDATTLAQLLADGGDAQEALKRYEAKRLKATGDVVLANRGIAPDAIIRVVEERTGGKPFDRIEDVISHEDLVQWQERYRQVAGFSSNKLNAGQ